jgi:hypothetical protein
MSSVFRIRPRLAALALASLLGVLQPAFAVPGESCGSVDRLTVALGFAQVIFPELKGKEFTVSFAPGNGTFIVGPTQADDVAVRIDDQDNFLWHPPDETADQYYAAQFEEVRRSGIELPLDLRFSFIDIHGPLKPRHLTCEPSEFTSDVGHAQMEKVYAVLNPHPEWSDAEELSAARKLGLRYGPEEKSAILEKLPLKQLAEFYGKLRIKSAEFLINGGGKCVGCSFVYPRWNVYLSGASTPRGLFIVVEPFFGKITHIGE